MGLTTLAELALLCLSSASATNDYTFSLIENQEVTVMTGPNKWDIQLSNGNTFSLQQDYSAVESSGQHYLPANQGNTFVEFHISSATDNYFIHVPTDASNGPQTISTIAGVGASGQASRAITGIYARALDNNSANTADQATPTVSPTKSVVPTPTAVPAKSAVNSQTDAKDGTQSVFDSAVDTGTSSDSDAQNGISSAYMGGIISFSVLIALLIVIIVVVFNKKKKGGEAEEVNESAVIANTNGKLVIHGKLVI
jgi:hypothetical protein